MLRDSCPPRAQAISDITCFSYSQTPSTQTHQYDAMQTLLPSHLTARGINWEALALAQLVLGASVFPVAEVRATLRIFHPRPSSLESFLCLRISSLGVRELIRQTPPVVPCLHRTHETGSRALIPQMQPTVGSVGRLPASQTRLGV